ncbi:Microfibrillar-associated protein 1 [Rhodotorula toruloides ATCC 204091]|nr:Microfibrillar-associated protein 1 [Rhodotorula toruloides ATCC 204091]
MASLQQNPKVYCVWEHRKWVLETMTDADWGWEIKMVEMYLEKDARNFHSWDYRRYLISSILALPSDPSPSRSKPLPRPTTESELAFTTRKISANFSNFSAWHYRTKLLAKLWDEKGWRPDAKERLERVDQEFELVKQAIWSDPNDQSAWLYHRWLVGEGCLDSLVYYKRLLVRLLEAQGDATRHEREELNLACVEMLDKLKEVDPMRRARYQDLISRDPTTSTRSKTVSDSMNGSRGKLTQPLRPVGRYRPGKAPVPVATDDDSDEEEQQQQVEGEGGADHDEADEQVHEFSAARRDAAPAGRINVALREVEVDKAGKVKVGGKDEVGRTEMESSEGEYGTFRRHRFVAQVCPITESSEYETDSEEEEPLKPIYKPVFVSKRNRDTLAEKKELDAEALEAQREAEEKKRREEAKAMVAESIVREISTKEAEETHPDVDDTDGLDPEGEFEAWKLRELMRLKRDREARYALEKIREEVEARRALPEELRLKEDMERADKTRKEKKKGQQVFLQKYHHKGVFHQDLDILKKHDYTAPTASTITDVSSLPAVMQKRNFGKAHQTKYTHLAAEDTSRTSGGWGKPSGPGGGAGGGKDGGCFLSSATARNSMKAPRPPPLPQAPTPRPPEQAATPAGLLVDLLLHTTTDSHQVEAADDEAGLAMDVETMIGEAEEARGGGRGVGSGETGVARLRGTAITTEAMEGRRSGMAGDETRITLARLGRGGMIATATGTTGDEAGVAAGVLDEANEAGTAGGNETSVTGGIGTTSGGDWIIERVFGVFTATRTYSDLLREGDAGMESV